MVTYHWHVWLLYGVAVLSSMFDPSSAFATVFYALPGHTEPRYIETSYGDNTHSVVTSVSVIEMIR